MMFEEPLFSQLDSWGKGKTAHYLQTVIKARARSPPRAMANNATSMSCVSCLCVISCDTLCGMCSVANVGDVVQLLTLIDGVNRGQPSASEKRGPMMLEILHLIANNFPFILPHHIAANLRLALAQVRPSSPSPFSSPRHRVGLLCWGRCRSKDCEMAAGPLCVEI
jgi:hypothetical protein